MLICNGNTFSLAQMRTAFHCWQSFKVINFIPWNAKKNRVLTNLFYKSHKIKRMHFFRNILHRAGNQAQFGHSQSRPAKVDLNKSALCANELRYLLLRCCWMSSFFLFPQTFICKMSFSLTAFPLYLLPGYYGTYSTHLAIVVHEYSF